MLLILSLLILPVLAQRPSTASLCDFYAIKLYGSNSSTTQFNLVQSIIAMAFAGGSGLPNTTADQTGTFNPGFYTLGNINYSVDLGAFFNGSLASTNVNGAPATLNWLDGGGKAPLQNFLTGKTDNIVFANTTNEYRLFSHWLGAFSHIFSCTYPAPVPPQTGGVPNLAYVHKFMDLNQTDIGHFIDQIVQATLYFGFSQQDSNQLSTDLNSKYNVRCSPAQSGSTQLYSLCQDDSCPLAPNPDCGAYGNNLGPSGIISSAATASATASTSASTSITSATSSTTTPASSQTSQPSSSSPAIGAGAIAGIVIGSIALLCAFILALVFLLRKRNSITPLMYEGSPSTAPARTDPHSSYISHQRVQAWNGPPIAEMEHTGSPDITHGGFNTPEMRMSTQ